MSRNPQRIAEMLDLLEAIWKKNPDLRLGQMIQNCEYEGHYISNYQMEDDELYKRLCQLYNQ